MNWAFRICAGVALCSVAACGGSDGADTAGDGAEATGDAAETLAAAPDPGPLPPAVGEGSVERISFARGASSAVTQGSVTGYAHIDYILNVRQGQSMNISLATDNTANYFNVLEPGETEVAVYNSSIDGNQYEGTANKSGDYRIRVYLMRNAARREETANFRLETAVSGAAASSAGKQAASGDPIRGPGGLEQKCKDRVADVTGAAVTGTNHIEESEAAIEIFVNVQGAEAPWRCLGYRDGTIGDVEFTGDEGAL